ncbi:MAG: ribulose-phosphate 3-epimerase [Anaerolineae bacterium]
MIKIASSILAADFTRLREQVAEAETAGADYIHIDVMDGHFVPNITVGPLVVRAVRRVTRLPLSVHLMIEAPESYLDAFAEAGADTLTVHVETCPHLHRTVQQIKELGTKAGVSLNPATPLVSLEEMLEYVDLILLMTVNPGFGGQEFIESSLPRIRRLREMLAAKGLEVELGVDGGINAETAPRVVAAGADVLIAGEAIFGAREGVAEAMRRIRESLQTVTQK